MKWTEIKYLHSSSPQIADPVDVYAGSKARTSSGCQSVFKDQSYMGVSSVDMN